MDRKLDKGTRRNKKFLILICQTLNLKKKKDVSTWVLTQAHKVILYSKCVNVAYIAGLYLCLCLELAPRAKAVR